MAQTSLQLVNHRAPQPLLVSILLLICETVVNGPGKGAHNQGKDPIAPFLSASSIPRVLIKLEHFMQS